MGNALPIERLLHAGVRHAIGWRSGAFAELHAGAMAQYDQASPAQARARSLRLLRHVVFRAYHHVPHYHQVLTERRLTPRDVRDFDDLRLLPLLGRDDIRRAGSALHAGGRSRIGARKDATGGSTGTPVEFLRSVTQAAAIIANEDRTWRWYGVAPGARQALIWGADRDVPPTEDALRWPNRLLGIRRLNAFALDDDRCAIFAGQLNDFQPEIIYGYATALHRFAQWTQANPGRLRISPLAIRSSAEVLLPEARASIEAAFGGPVFDYYGARDCGPIAGECRARDGMHVYTDVTWVEIVRDDGSPCAPGEVGEVVITKLLEHAMPLIRYRTGDRAAWHTGEQPCSCGLTLPRMTQLAGRVGDFVVTPKGASVHGEYFTHLFYHAAGVARFQVRQVAADRLRILVEPSPGQVPAAELLAYVQQASADKFGAGPDAVTVELVRQIVPGATGKHRFVLPLGATAAEPLAWMPQ